MTKDLFEKYFPGIFYVGAMACSLTGGGKYSLDDGLYAGKKQTGASVERYLRKLSKKFHLIATVNTTKGEAIAEFEKLTAAGWALVAPGDMYTRRLHPFIFCLYGAPLKKGKPAPPLPSGVRHLGDAYRRCVVDLLRGVFVSDAIIRPAKK